MKPRRAIASHLGAAACVGLFLSGGAAPVVPLGCLLAILFDTAWFAPRGASPRPPVLVALQVLLAVPFGYLALLRDPPVDFLSLLLLATAPLIVIRSLHEETEFNDFLIILLSLLLVVGSAAVAPGAMPVLITAVYVLVGCQALRVLASRREHRKSSVRFRLEGPVGWWSTAPAFAAHHLGVGGLVLGAVFYLVAPRPDIPADDGMGAGGPPTPLAGRPGTERTTGTRTDFPREVRLGDIGKVKRRPFPALRVEIRAHGRPYDPDEGERSMLLLRARAWEQYVPATRRWEPSRSPARPIPANGTIEAGPTELDWSFDVLGYDGKTLFLPPRARRVRAAGGDLAIDRTGVVTSSVPVFQYAVASARPVDAGDLEALVPDLRDRRLLDVPDAVARVLRPELPPAPRESLRGAAVAVAEYFGSGEFRYTLDIPPSIDRAADPIAAFLAERQGDCELYATTACLFLRLMGVPARVAGGLRCAERIGQGKYLARFSNAHAWVEVPCRDVGFVALDFTPPDAAAAPLATEEANAVAEEEGGRGGEEEALLDWRDPFAYGPQEQERMIDWIGDRLITWPTLAVLLGFLLFLVLPPAVVAVRSRPRSPLQVTAPEGQRRSTLAFYARWLRDCAAKGYVRARVDTPREFLALLPPEMRAEGLRVTDEFERRRYGPP